MKKGIDSLYSVVLYLSYRSDKRFESNLKKLHDMTTTKSTIDSDYKLLTYSNGVEYIVYNSASWLVGADDEIGNSLKKKYFLKKATLEQRIKQWFEKQRYVSTLGRSCGNVKSIAVKLGVTTNKIYSVLRNSDWCDAKESYTSTRYNDCKSYFVYRYNG